MKLKWRLLHQIPCAGAFVLCSKGLVKLSRDEIFLWRLIFGKGQWKRKKTLKFAKTEQCCNCRTHFTSINGESPGWPNHGKIESWMTGRPRYSKCWPDCTRNCVLLTLVLGWSQYLLMAQLPPPNKMLFTSKVVNSDHKKLIEFDRSKSLADMVETSIRKPPASWRPGVVKEMLGWVFTYITSLQIWSFLKSAYT